MSFRSIVCAIRFPRFRVFRVFCGCSLSSAVIKGEDEPQNTLNTLKLCINLPSFLYTHDEMIR